MDVFFFPRVPRNSKIEPEVKRSRSLGREKGENELRSREMG